MKIRPLFILFFFLAALPACGDKPLTDYSNVAGKFKAKFPGTPKVNNIAGKNNVLVIMHGAEASSGAFFVSYYDSPVPLPNDKNFAETALTQEVNGMIAGQKEGRLNSSTFVKLQDKYFGIELGVTGRPRIGTVGFHVV